MAYYVYAWYIVLNNESKNRIENRLFEAGFEARVHGAVYPELHELYKSYGTKAILQQESNVSMFSTNDLDVLEQVRDVYD